MVISIFLYTCEWWTFTKDVEKKYRAAEMRCLRKLLGISYKDHITNKEVKNRIRNHNGHYEGLLSTVKRWRLIGYGFVSNWERPVTGMEGGDNTLSYVVSTDEQTTEMMMTMMLKSHLWCPHGRADYGNDNDDDVDDVAISSVVYRVEQNTGMMMMMIVLKSYLWCPWSSRLRKWWWWCNLICGVLTVEQTGVMMRMMGHVLFLNILLKGL